MVVLYAVSTNGWLGVVPCENFEEKRHKERAASARAWLVVWSCVFPS